MPPTLRDRILTRKVGEALVSPSAITLAGAGAAAAILVGLGPIGAVVGAVLAWAGRVAVAVPRAPRSGRMDPFTLDEPWRRMVQGALAAHTQFQDAVRRTPVGPLRERLGEIGGRISEGVDDAWRVAQAGNALSDARARIDLGALQRDLDELSTEDRTDPTIAQTAEALQSQIATGQRMDRAIADARNRLRLLTERMDEAVTRSIELSAGVSSEGQLDAVGNDVTSIATELEALRQAVVAVEATDDAHGAAGSTA